MNWDAIAAIAEVIGVVGIVVSIIYLGIQVRHSNQVAEDASFKTTFGLGMSVYLEMIEGENVDVVMSGLLNYDELRGREKMIFDNVMTCWFGVAESALLAQDLDIAGDQTADTLMFAFRTRFFPYTGIHSWWSEAKGLYPPEVQQWIKREVDKSDMSDDFYGIKTRV